MAVGVPLMSADPPDVPFRQRGTSPGSAPDPVGEGATAQGATAQGATGDPRRSAPAARRNMVPIREALAAILRARGGTLFEVASGTGEHAADWAAAFPALTVQPSDADPENCASIDAWRAASGLGNLRAPIRLDIREPWPDLGPLTAVVAVNLVHIAPWPVAEALIAGAARHLAPDGLLILYGPFKRGGRHTAASNARFDEALRARNPDWGVRDLTILAGRARAAGLGEPILREMPANNLTVAFPRR